MPAPLTPPQAAALRLLDRYGLLFVPLVHRLVCPDATPDNARKLLANLARRGWLKRYTPQRGLAYFVLSRSAARELGLHRRVSRPFGYAAFVRAYAIACHCAAAGLTRLTPAEWAARHPDKVAPGVSDRFYAETEAGVTVLIVDEAFAPRRIVSKLHKAVARRLAVPGLLALADAGRLSLTVLTPTDGKAATLRRDVARRYAAGVPVRVAVVPELQQVLVRRF